VAELSLDDVERYAFAGHLDRVHVSKLVRRESPTHTRAEGKGAQRRSDGGRRPWSSLCWAVDDAQQRADRQRDSDAQPRVDLLPGPPVHADLASLSAIAATNEDAAARPVKVTLGQRKRLADAQPGAQSTTMSARVLRPCVVSPATRMTATISSTAGGSAGYRSPLLRGGRPQWKPGMVAGDRRRPAASSKTGLVMHGRSRESVLAAPRWATARRPKRGRGVLLTDRPHPTQLLR
jgi:hypothetical protein